MRLHRLSVSGLCLAAVLALAAPAAVAAGLVETIKQTPELGTLAKAIANAKLENDLGKDGLTVFAPSDAAFGAMPGDSLAGFMKPESKAALTALLKHHVATGRIAIADSDEGNVQVHMLDGSTLFLNMTQDGRDIDGVVISTRNIEAGKSVIHIIDDVLIQEGDAPLE